MPSVLISLCATPPDARDQTLRWLDAEIQRAGGDPEAAWRARGKDLSEVSDLLLLWRTRYLIQKALALAAADCPFFIEPSPTHPGIHGDADKTLLYAEGGARVVATNLGRRLSAGAMTGGRLFLGRGLSHDWTALVGLEGNVSALFSPGSSSVIDSQPRVMVTFALPVIVRRFGVAQILDLEGAGTATYTEVDRRVAPGMRVGVALGAATVRVRGLMPLVAGFASAEVSFRPDGTLLFIGSFGVRGGVDWTPWSP